MLELKGKRVHIVRRSLLELSRSKVEIVETVSYFHLHLLKISSYLSMWIKKKRGGNFESLI